MSNLVATNQSIELVLSDAGDVDWTSNWTVIDKSTPNQTVTTPDADSGNETSAGDVTIISAPGGADIYHVPRGITVRNKDSAPNTVTLQKDVGGAEYEICKVTLATMETLIVDEEGDVTVLNASGVPKNALMISPNASVMMAPHFSTANLTGVKTITSLSTFAVYIGKAPRALTAVTLRSRVTTAMATITWGEVAIAKGAINPGGNPTLTVVGYTDVSATFNSLGQKSTSISVASGQSINEGDDLWVLIGNQATTAAIMRAQSIADDLQVGLQAAFAVRPSTIVGTPTVFTLEGATTLAAWVALVV
jgi:hypothetical protein